MFPTWWRSQLDASLSQNDNAAQASLLTGDVNGDFSSIVQKIRDQISSGVSAVMASSKTIGTMGSMLTVPQFRRDLRAFLNPQPTEQVAAADEQMSIGIGAPPRRAYGGGRL